MNNAHKVEATLEATGRVVPGVNDETNHSAAAEIDERISTPNNASGPGLSVSQPDSQKAASVDVALKRNYILKIGVRPGKKARVSSTHSVPTTVHDSRLNFTPGHITRAPDVSSSEAIAGPSVSRSNVANAGGAVGPRRRKARTKGKEPVRAKAGKATNVASQSLPVAKGYPKPPESATALGSRKVESEAAIPLEGWLHLHTQESRNNSEAAPNLYNERLSLRHEWGCVVKHMRGTFNLLAGEVFAKIKFNKSGTRFARSFWPKAIEDAASLAEREDVRALIADMGDELEETMYPAFLALSELVLLYCTQVDAGGKHLPPQPFFVQNVEFKDHRRWVKTEAAMAWRPVREPAICVVDTHDDPVEGLAVKEKPDMLVIRSENKLAPSMGDSDIQNTAYAWNLALAVIEFKKKKGKNKPTSRSQVDASSSSTATSSSSTKPKKPRNISLDADRETSYERSANTLKKQNPFTSPKPEGKYPEPPPHIQACRYGMGPNSALGPLRRFTVIVLFTGLSMELFVVDRKMTLISQSCSFRDDPTPLVGLLIALMRSGSHALGYEPKLVANDQFPTEMPNLTIGGLTYPKGMPEDDRLIRAKDILRLCEAEELRWKGSEEEAEARDAENSAEFKPPSKETEGVTYEVRLDQGEKNLASKQKPVKEHKLFLSKSFPPRLLTGNGTSVFRGTVSVTSSSVYNASLSSWSDDYAIKFSWHEVCRFSESRLLRIANARGIPGIPTLLASKCLAQGADPLSTRCRILARCLPQFVLDPAQDRELWVYAIQPVCMPLPRVKDLGSLLTAFDGLLHAFASLNAAGILHADICTSNLMVDLKDHSRGILVDFDRCIREPFPQDGHGEFAEGIHCQAVKLCVEKPPQPTFESGIESFFWALWDIILTYRAGTRVTLTFEIDWRDGPLIQVRDNKILFFSPDKAAARDEQVERFCASMGFRSNALSLFMSRWTSSMYTGHHKKAPVWDHATLRRELEATISGILPR